MLNEKEKQLLKQTGVNDKEVTEKLVNFLRHEFDNVVRVTKEDYNKGIAKLVDNKQGSYTFIDDESGDFLAKVSIFNKEVDGENIGLSFVALNKQGWLLTKDDNEEIVNLFVSDILNENNVCFGIDLGKQLVDTLDGKTIATQEWANTAIAQAVAGRLIKYSANDIEETVMEDLEYPCLIECDDALYLLFIDSQDYISGFYLYSDIPNSITAICSLEQLSVQSAGTFTNYDNAVTTNDIANVSDIKPIYCHPVNIGYKDASHEFMLTMLIFNNSDTPFTFATFNDWLTALESQITAVRIMSSGYVVINNVTYPVSMLFAGVGGYRQIVVSPGAVSNIIDSFTKAEWEALIPQYFNDGFNRIN